MTLAEGEIIDEGSTYKAHTILSAMLNILFICVFLLYFGGLNGLPILFICVALIYASEKAMKDVKIFKDARIYKKIKLIEKIVDVFKVFLALILGKIIFFEGHNFFKAMPEFIILSVVFITMEFLRMYIGVIVRRKPDVVEL